jgi:hypothetical protein
MMKVDDVGLMPADEINQSRDALIVLPYFVDHIVVVDRKDGLVAVDHFDGWRELFVRSDNCAGKERIYAMFPQELALSLGRDFPAAKAVSRRRVGEDGNTG